MRRLLIMCMVSIFPFTSALAQAQEPDHPDSGWEVVQNCVGELPASPLPRDQWDFEGVIFTDSADGVRAIRTDMATSYFVAFNGPSSFASAGSFSPNGQWFAYPIGETDWNVNSGWDDAYAVEAIRVVSTDPSQSAYQIPWYGLGISSSASRALRAIEWISNDQFVANESMFSGGGVVSAFTAEVVPWDRETSLGHLSHFSPDFTRAIYIDQYGEKITGIYDIENDTLIATWPLSNRYYAAWMLDSSGVVLGWPGESDAEGSESIDLWWFDRDGQPIEMIMSDIGLRRIHPVFSPDGEKLAFISGRQGLLVADFTQKRIIDYCLGGELNYGTEVVWSPDGTTLAFNLYSMTIPYEHVLLNTETLEIKALDFPGDSLMGWYPLP